ncbi:MAG: hypothetical protein ACK55I_43825, partial [bacterium]
MGRAPTSQPCPPCRLPLHCLQVFYALDFGGTNLRVARVERHRGEPATVRLANGGARAHQRRVLLGGPEVALPRFLDEPVEQRGQWGSGRLLSLRGCHRDQDREGSGDRNGEQATEPSSQRGGEWHRPVEVNGGRESN